MNKLSRLLSNVIKFSNIATYQYQFVKIAMSISDITNTDLVWNNKSLEQSFSKFIDSVIKLEDILNGDNIADEVTSSEEYLTEVSNNIAFWSEKVKESAINMSEKEWLLEVENGNETLAQFMIEANNAIDKAIETFTGMTLDETIAQQKADEINDKINEANIGGIKGNQFTEGLSLTGGSAEARLRASQKYMEKLKFLRKVNPQAPEWLKFKAAVKKSNDEKRIRINKDPKLREAWKQLNNKKYKMTRKLHEEKIERLKKDIERYESESRQYNTSKNIERARNLIKELSKNYVFNEGARTHQAVIQERIKDEDSMMGRLRNISLRLASLKLSIKNKLEKKYKKDLGYESKIEEAKKAGNKEEVIKLLSEINNLIEKDPVLLDFLNDVKLIQTYTLRVKSVNMRSGDGVKPETTSIAVDAIALGKEILTKLGDKYKGKKEDNVSNEIFNCNRIMEKQVKELLNITDDSAPQTVYFEPKFDDEEAPDTIKEDTFKSESVYNRMKQLKKIAQLSNIDMNDPDFASNAIDSVINNIFDELVNIDV